MKIEYLVYTFLLFTNISFAGNYVLTIDKKGYDISLGEELQIQLDDRSVSVSIIQKDNLIFKTDSFSFEYPKIYSPSTADLGGGIIQTTMFTPLGAGVVVQEYTNMDPSHLIELMISEITKEEREYGYKIKSKKTSMTLSDGTILNGKVVTSKYKGSDIKRVFYTYSARDAGLFIMTQIDFDVASSDKSVIDKVIKTFSITME